MPFSPSRLAHAFLFLMLTGSLLSAALPAAAWPAPRGVVVEDFESGSVVLGSYLDQDQDPDDWQVTPANTHDGSDYALRLFGNTWKTQAIAPLAVAAETVWQVAVYVEEIGEMQGFGVSDGVADLIYTFAGSQLPEGEHYYTVYQGAYDIGQWIVYLLPIGEDWLARYGSLPVVGNLIYFNDNDAGGQGGSEVFFDTIVDVTEDMPLPPVVDASYEGTALRQLSANVFRASVQFYGAVIDPDSGSHVFHWDFGDSTASDMQNPTHDFVVSANYRYTVSLLATDPDGLADSDTVQVSVEAGDGDLPFTMNAVGDIMIGRNYESPGGIIDELGVDAIFEPTYGIFGFGADVSLANLEVPFTDRGTRHPTKSVVFRARPESMAGVANAGIELVTLGNNHIVDYGEVGMLDTIELLEQNGIIHFGAGISDYFAMRPAFWTERGVRIALLGQSNRTGRRWNYQPFLDAGASKPGFAYLLPHNLEESILAVRDQADILIVTTHSGDEYQTQAPGEGDPGGAFPAHEHGEAHIAIESNDPSLQDFHFRNEPTPSERELRRMAIDLGADILINHHPHVLQGFEVYEGKLIVHSLGNFIFDLYYPETMPTGVFTMEIDKSGIVGYTFVPAWIDDYITQPATGQLGREILDRMADYSRVMNALMAVDTDANEGRIYIDPGEPQTSVVQTQVTVPFRDEGGEFVSEPIAVAGDGSLSRIVTVNGDLLVNYEVCYGREILWHGNFEADGATFWDVNTQDEWLDDTVAQAGLRSLALRRDQGDGGEVGTDLEKHLPCEPGKRHSFSSWMMGENAKDANVLARFYEGRSSGTALSSTELGPWLDGDAEWYAQWAELETPENAYYFELRCTMELPANGEARAWFDELKMIEWDDWLPGEPDIAVPHPNNYRFVQIRSSDPGLGDATVVFEETGFRDPLTNADGGIPVPVKGRMEQNYPNPFNPNTSIELAAPAGLGALPVELAIYDARGRRLATLFQGEMRGGERRVFEWDGRDDRGGALASGVYFSRARFGDQVFSRKMLLLK